jgi:hypothetical protein
MVDEIETSAPASRLGAGIEPEQGGHLGPEREGEADLDDRDKASRRDDAGQRAKIELQAEREHQQDDAKLGEGADRLFVGEERDGRVRPDDDARQQVAEHHGKAQLLACHGGECRRAENQGQVQQEGVRAHRAGCRCM